MLVILFKLLVSLFMLSFTALLFSFVKYETTIYKAKRMFWDMILNWSFAALLCCGFGVILLGIAWLWA